MKRIKIICILSWIWFVILLGIPKQDIEPVENLAVELGAGFDLIKTTGNDYIYKIIRNIQIVGQNGKLMSKNYEGSASSMGKTRDERKTGMDKQNLQGMEKLYAISESQGEEGVKNIIDIIFRNPVISDTAFIVISKCDVTELLKYKPQGEISSSEYIYGMIESNKVNNFFSDNYLAVDMYVRMEGEGKNMTVPCIDIGEQGLYIWGFGLFEKNKLVGEMNIAEAKIMNLLRENKVQGTVSIRKSSKEYIDFYCKTKRKVTCDKIDNKYKFTINLELSGDVVGNELYEDLSGDSKKVKEFEKDMSNSVKIQCDNFIEKMKNTYKLDWIELGKYAVAKYGRKTGVDWNEIAVKSEIDVKVKVKVNKLGRGDY